MDGGAAETGIGQPVRRREDLRLLTGRGRYSDDLNLPGQAYAVMVRSPHAHALIRSDRHRRRAGGAGGAGGADRRRCCAPTGSTRCRTSPTTIRPISASRTRTARRRSARSSRRSSAPKCAMSARSSPPSSRPSLAAAKDAAELVAVDYEVIAGGRAQPRRRRTATRRARGRTAPTSSSTARSAIRPRPRPPSPRAAHVVRFETWVQRIAGVPMEPRAAIGEYDAADRPLHAARRRRRRGQPEARSGARARRPARAGARRHARCRRQFRHARRLQPGIRDRGLGGAAGRPAGQMDLRAQRIFLQRLPGARSRRRPPNWRSTRDGTFPRDARLEPRQPGRLRARLRLPEQGGRDHVEHLPRAGRASSAPAPR